MCFGEDWIGRENLVKKRGLGGLVRGKEHAGEAILPRHSGSGRIDAMVPIEIDVSVALPLAIGHGLAYELAKLQRKLACSSSQSLPLRVLLPPVTNGAAQV